MNKGVNWFVVGAFCLLGWTQAKVSNENFGTRNVSDDDAAHAKNIAFDFGWRNGTDGDETYLASSGCSIDLNGGLSSRPPILIQPGTERFMHPQTSSGVIHFGLYQSVELYCSVSFTDPYAGTQSLLAQCLGNNRFLIDGKLVPIQNLTCTANARHVDRLAARNTCGPNITHIEIGFRVSATRFLKTQDVCHDEHQHNTLYTYYRQTPANDGFVRAFPRPGFIRGSFYAGMNVDNLYSRATQRETIGRIIGAERVAKLFGKSHNSYLARGHLAARSDFITGPEQRASFFFVNAAPQWQSFNAGNWERIEFGVKRFVAERKLYTTIHTGTVGVLRLADKSGVEHELYLHFDASGRGVIPVPMYFYKVVIDDRRRGIVFVGLNNPFVTREEVLSGRFDLCRDIGAKVNYVNWNRDNLALGYSYACEVNEFLRVVKHLPRNLFADGLLL